MENKINPFVRNLTINVKVDKVYAKRDFDVFTEKFVELEADRYLKLFCYKPINKQLIRTLSPTASNMFNYIITEILTGEDCIRIDRKRYKEATNIKSDTTITSALKELIDKAVISKTSEKDLYWINPDIFFTGNRINKYRDSAIINQIEYDINRR